MPANKLGKEAVSTLCNTTVRFRTEYLNYDVCMQARDGGGGLHVNCVLLYVHTEQNQPEVLLRFDAQKFYQANGLHLCDAFPPVYSLLLYMEEK